MTVNGKSVTSPSQKGVVAILDDVVVQGFGLLPKVPPVENAQPSRASAKILAVHKMKGELVANQDNKQRPLLIDRVRRLINYDFATLKPVDRMDFNTEGLLLLTNYGSLSRTLAGS